MSDRRTHLGLLLAPLVPAGLMASYLVAVGNRHEFTWILLVGGTAVVSCLGFFAVGLPIIASLRRSQRLGYVSLPAAGAISGALVLLSAFGLLKWSLGMKTSSLLAVAVVGAGFGMAVAIAFAAISGVLAIQRAKSGSDSKARNLQ